ncbi:MAG: replicative DNA helicase [Mycobacterium sp.]
MTAATTSHQNGTAEPRHDLGAEQAVIGSMLQDRRGDLFDEIVSVLRGPTDFYDRVNAELYSRLLTYREEQKPLGDPMTFLGTFSPQDAKRLKAGDYLQTCMSAAAIIEHGPFYAKEVLGLAVLRDLDEHGLRTRDRVRKATATQAPDLIEWVQADAAEVSQQGTSNLDVPIWDLMATDAVEDMGRIQELAQSDVLPGVPTGWTDVDRLLSNLQPGQVIVFAGRPGIGKSVAGRGIAQHHAMRRRGTALIFSLEMSRSECMMALISAGAGVALHSIRSGKLHDDDWTKIGRYLGQNRGARLMIDDTPGASLPHARKQMRRLIRADLKPEVVVWDYLQLTDVPGYEGRRQEAVSALSRGFKLFAKEYQIPVVLISQLNRGPDARADKRPQLSDLRESGSIEQDADVVCLLHRDDYYDQESPKAGEMELIFAKHRGGPTGTVTLAAQLHYQRLMDMPHV